VECEEKTCTKFHNWILEQMKGEKIAIFGQKVPKNIYLSNKCLLAESSKEYMHAFCN
jgi:hypothetical protein